MDRDCPSRARHRGDAVCAIGRTGIDMGEDLPIGFAVLPLGRGFAEAFGPIYVNRARRARVFRVARFHLNPVNVCNGGALATFADMQIAAVIAAGPGTSEGHQPTISLSIDYLATAPLGSWVEAEVTLIKTTRTLIFTQALISANGAIVARSNAIYRNYGHGAQLKASSKDPT
jgi:acyl-coenzyme A thioesterase PaaI-like protein